ncbi:MAG: hypothetical protein ACODAE_05250 [Gemmatimonadota bacterium]
MSGRDVTLELAGETRRLRYDFNALCDLEDALGRPLSALSEDSAGFREIRAMLWAGLIHEDPDLTLRDAGALLGRHIEDGGRLEAVGEATERAMARAGFETGEDGEAEDAAGNGPAAEAA